MEMPQGEVRDWERLALEGPGLLQLNLLVAQIVLILSSQLGVKTPWEDLVPWLDGLFGDPGETRSRREEERRRVWARKVADLGEAAYKREAGDGAAD